MTVLFAVSSRHTIILIDQDALLCQELDLFFVQVICINFWHLFRRAVKSCYTAQHILVQTHINGYIYHV